MATRSYKKKTWSGLANISQFPRQFRWLWCKVRFRMGTLGTRRGQSSRLSFICRVKWEQPLSLMGWTRLVTCVFCFYRLLRYPFILLRQPSPCGTQSFLWWKLCARGYQIQFTQNISSFRAFVRRWDLSHCVIRLSHGTQCVGMGEKVAVSVVCFTSVSSPVWFSGAWSLLCFFILQSLELAFLRLQPPISPPQFSSWCLTNYSLQIVRISQPWRSWLVFLFLGWHLLNPSWPLRLAVLYLLPGCCHGALMVGLGSRCVGRPCCGDLPSAPFAPSRGCRQVVNTLCP